MGGPPPRPKVPALSVALSLSNLQDQVDPKAHNGIPAYKVTSRGVAKSRVLTLSKDRFAIFITHKALTVGETNAAAADNDNRALKKILSNVPIISSKGFFRKNYVRMIHIADVDHVQMGYIGTRKLELTHPKAGTKKKIGRFEDGIVSIFHHGDQTLDVVVPSLADAQTFVNTVKLVMKTYRDAVRNVASEELLLRYVWQDIDFNKNGLIELHEFYKLLKIISFSPPSHLAKDTFTKLAKNRQGSIRKKSKGRKACTYYECLALLDALKRDAESNIVIKGKTSNQLIEDLVWDAVFGADVNTVSSTVFTETFLHGIQGDADANVEDVESLFAVLNDTSTEKGVIDRPAFQIYLHHAVNNAYDPDSQVMNIESMSKPLSHYWINSSHNTYLTGDQLQSSSSVGMYTEALYRGCKCLELDCWDGDKEGNRHVPVVYHGYTLTSHITFESIIKCVENYMLSNPNTYPIILSLENHCSFPYQKVMAEILETHIGKYLYVPDAAALSKPGAELPSPASLVGKVIIKGKRPPEKDMKEGDESENDSDTGDEGEAEMKTNESNTNPKSKDSAPSTHAKVVPELAKLTLLHGHKLKKFETSIEAHNNHMHSIGETKITRLLEKSGSNAALWRKYNVNHMSRTYPAGTRITSSNYNPTVAWAMGCQLVALNFQTNDSSLLLNDGRFLQNDNCGYVLKPASVMGSNKASSPQKVYIRVLSASCLPRPTQNIADEIVDPFIDPYCHVTLHDCGIDHKDKEEYISDSKSTNAVDDNGFCPVWAAPSTHKESDKKDTFEFTVQNPDVAMIHFEVNDYDVIQVDAEIATASIPVSCLRKGFRTIHLYDLNGVRTGPFAFATLLVEIDIQ
eukprot:scaffold185564_cov50-Attheya_sp.AAC.2